jgi:hypothetical protein
MPEVWDPYLRTFKENAVLCLGLRAVGVGGNYGTMAVLCTSALWFFNF